jgi:hypothetical protein
MNATRHSIRYHAEDLKTRRFWVVDNERGTMVTKFATPEEAEAYVRLCDEIDARVQAFDDLQSEE